MSVRRAIPPSTKFFTAMDICGLIRTTFPQPAWATLFGVRDSTGWAGDGRTADAMAFGTWPSRGLRIVGFEIKSYRNDWKRELLQPEKAESIARYCDEWYIVASDAVIHEETEIPSTWGWYVPTDRGLKLARKSSGLKPKPADRIFLMSLIRNLSNSYVPMNQLTALAEKKAAEMAEAKGDELRREIEYAKKDLDEIKERVAAFEKASGIDIGKNWSHDSGQVGSLVKTIMGERNLVWQLASVKEAATVCSEILEKIREMGWYKDR